jgi:hypothetical protein
MQSSRLDASEARQLNPVWTVYNELRTARLNVKYLQHQIRALKRANLGYEIFLALAMSSAVAGFSFWQLDIGKATWAGIGWTAAVLAVLKPILKLPETFQRKQELLASYMILDHDLNTIRIEIQFRQKYDETLKRQFTRALQRKAELVQKDTASSVNERLRQCCYEEVLKELPTNSFYIPPET